MYLLKNYSNKLLHFFKNETLEQINLNTKKTRIIKLYVLLLEKRGKGWLFLQIKSTKASVYLETLVGAFSPWWP